MPSTEQLALPSQTKRLLSNKNFLFTVWFLFLTALASIPAYYRMFTDFAPWDDEGALMVTVKQYLSGMKLYEQFSIPYGPVYYFYNWALRILTHTPVTHDVVRMSSLIPWLLTALVSAWIIFRITDSLVLASATHILVFFMVSRVFHGEAGHPQELCMLLLVFLLAAGVLASNPRWRLQGMFLVGSIVAAITLTKINLGAFAFLAASLAILAHSPKTKLSTLAFKGIAVICVLFPAILMKAHLAVPLTRLFAVLVTASLIAVLLVLFRSPRTSSITFRDSVLAAVAFACTFSAIVLALKIQGITLTRVLHALLLDSLGPFIVHGSWHIPLPIPFGLRWYFWIAAGLVAAVFLSRNPSKSQQNEKYAVTLKFLLTLLTVIVFVFNASPLELLPPFLILVCPFSWLVLYQHPDDQNRLDSFGRTLLCTTAVLQTLYAYPIAGTQFEFAQILLMLVVVICFYDGLVWLRSRLPGVSHLVLRNASAVLLLGVAVFYVTIARDARDEYNSLPSLQLPGSARIHLSQQQARDYRWLVQQINKSCDVFIGLPGLPSLHIWTGKSPLDDMDMNDWMTITSNDQQVAAAAILAAHPRACAFYNPDLLAFWDHPHRDISALPLVRYIHDNFRVAGSTGQFSFLVRNDRALGSVR